MAVGKKLVVLGAGVGGLSVVKELTEVGVDLNGLDVTVVDEDFSHFLGFTLPWVMRGWRSQDSVPIRPTGEALSGVETVVGRGSGIDPHARTVTLVDSSTIDFDALIIATGARNVIDNTPGLQAAVDRGTAVHYYSAAAAADAHRALRSFSGGKLVFLVASEIYRCPVAPYEGTLLAADLLKETGTRAATQISIYSPEEQPMPSAGPYAGQELVGFLSEEGIQFFGGHAVTRVDAESSSIEFANGTVVDFDLLVFIPAHEPALTLDGSGWISVDPATMQTQHPGIFAIGDTAAVTAPSGKNLPKAAAFARNGGKAAARNALRHLGILDAWDILSGEGFCYIDTGGHTSSQGKGDFFAIPHPQIHLSQPSAQLYDDKQKEENDWRVRWERPRTV
ncbi:NAD(P)/FAD-dependent oxidoreductase [Mycolicibacter arupensis]|nr:FAD/NAD(P)-binding oxidoreductase [Mycolicibacter arupensis]MCV7275601.1 NAD(P)/FAD-dependent oxidoreductase [Mycolicibacter arupensis]